ncbi:MAG: STAS domain-containing protein, partial [Pyrinomonadaceae bacterium]
SRMPTRITQVDDHPSGKTLLRVEGSLTLTDAELLEKLCLSLRQERPDDTITIDLAELSFLDSESASVLCRLKQQLAVSLEGLHLFIQQAIQMAERPGVN